MCSGDDVTCPDFELHRQKLLDDLDGERRSFLKSAFLAGGGAAAARPQPSELITTSTAPRPTSAADAGRHFAAGLIDQGPSLITFHEEPSNFAMRRGKIFPLPRGLASATPMMTQTRLAGHAPRRPHSA